MSSTTLTIRVDAALERRVDKLVKSTRRSHSALVTEAIAEFVDVNEWQVAGIKDAIASMDRGEGVPHEQVKEWVRSWGSKNRRMG